ncbi:MAG TPA: hypothetical protein VJ617_13195, partial [Arthrobacter sp.]|nr:hypothetical protein [Arthrobacter sp.]
VEVKQKQTQPPTPGKRDKMIAKFETSCKNQTQSTGWTRPGQNNQSKNNWYQQTWHTIEFSNNRHTRHHHNQPAVDRSGATFQTYPVSRSFANRRFRDLLLRRTGPTRIRHAKKRAIFRLLKKGVCRYFSASAAATQKTIHGRNPHRKSTLEGAAVPRNP